MSAPAVPAVGVQVDGRPLAPAVRVLAVRVSSRFNAPAQCELTLHEPAGTRTWPAPVGLGTRLEVRTTGEDATLFAGEVTRVGLVRGPDGTTVTTVLGYDPLHRLRGRQTVRVFESGGATAVAAELVADLAVRVDGGDGPQPGGPARISQHRQSDFELLVEVAARAGRLVVLDGTVLRLATLAGFGAPVPLRYGYELFEATVEANLDRLAGDVTAYGWDPHRAQVARGQAGPARTGRRIELRVAAAPGTGALALLSQPAVDEPDATATAQLALDTREAAAVTLRGVAHGNAGLAAGTRIAVTGLDSTVDGQYVLCEVVHTLDGNGYRTAFSTEPPRLPAPAPGTALTLGCVAAVDDPENLGRVRVSLPALGDLDAGWLPVVCPGAGRGKGLVALPDVGDTVAVALPHGVPESGLVLGSLYGLVAPPDTGVHGGSVRSWSLRTAAGTAVVLDDEARSVRLADPAGSYVELAPGTVRLHAKTDLVVEAPGHAITIRAGSVDFEHAPL